MKSPLKEKLKLKASARGYNDNIIIEIVYTYLSHYRSGCTDTESYLKTIDEFNL